MMPKRQKDKAAPVDESLQESDADSEAYTQERIEAAREKLQAQQEQAREQFVFLGESDPDVEIPDPSERPIDTENMRDVEVEALRTQDAIASPDYEPKSGEEFAEETFDSPDINPEAKEFQVKEPDEFTGPEAAAEAAATGVNPRSAATASDREGMEQPSDQLTPISENAEPVTEAGEPSPETPDVLDD